MLDANASCRVSELTAMEEARGWRKDKEVNTREAATQKCQNGLLGAHSGAQKMGRTLYSPGVDKSSTCLDHEWHQRHED